jgi:hypothetical protein
MEETIRRIARYILDKKFPGFEDVLVTKEQIVPSRFNSENNLVYNIFLVINFREHGIQYIDKMQDIKKLIEETIRVAGIKNRIKFYTHYSDED